MQYGSTPHHASVTSLSEKQERIAVIDSCRHFKRKGIKPAEAWELLEMLGLDAMAVEMRGNRRPEPVATPEASTARLCPKGLHDMDVHGRQRKDNRRWWCSACAYAAQKLARDVKRGIDTPVGPDPRLGPGERFCTCETPHIITVGNSDTTYVTPKTGKRRCRFARQRAQEIRKRAA